LNSYWYEIDEWKKVGHPVDIEMKEAYMIGTIDSLAKDVLKDAGFAVDHDPRSVEIYKAIAHIDFKHMNDCFGFQSGGDGDNGEVLMAELDLYFAAKDALEKAFGK
jgi:hypothetical protein